MKMNRNILLISIISLILFVGCGTVNKSTITHSQDEKKSNQYLIGKGSLNTIDSKEWEESYGKQNGIFTKDFGEYSGYLIGLGKRSTGGYSINLNINKEEVNKFIITYQEVEPTKNSFTTQVITYNYNVVYIRKGNNKVEILQIKNGKEVNHTDDIIR